MGVNNLLSFLRSTNVNAENVQRLMDGVEYDLYVDLAIIVVPLMQRSRSILHFSRLLACAFGAESDTNGRVLCRSSGDNELVRLFVRAGKLSMFLDMLSPRMKTETHNYRTTSRNLDQSYHVDRVRGVRAIDRSRMCVDVPESRGVYTCGIVGDNDVCYDDDLLLDQLGEVEQSRLDQKFDFNVRLNVVKLRDVRKIIPDIILASLRQWDATLPARCTIETEVVGEGEIKCIRSAILSLSETNSTVRCVSRTEHRPIVVLSNDNDVILMMLMHQSKIIIDRRTTTLFYRVLVNEKSSYFRSPDQDDVRAGELVVASFPLRMCIQQIMISESSVTRRMATSDRWRLLLWLICCCGTDFVSPMRPFTVSRRVDIFNLRLKRYAEDSLREKNDVVRLNLDSFLVELRHLVTFVENTYSVDVSDDSHVNSEFCLRNVGSSYARRMTVAGWILRLYWNLLYLIDLPIDFFNNPSFPSDDTLAVNCYVPHQYISIFAVLGVFHARHNDDLKADIAHLLLFSENNKY